ncbi:MAG: hypothetical protein IT472_08880 [Thermomonas sp.]|uniref:PBECR3 domain-containing polyvalent protein n=1 Tax=Thermomonas sp. TaxID=1971895 RepID=UPI00262B5217|nr:phage minor head protein [Thermomonas sp.]MCC7097279.1 hypothetical protein [Thermomonas sp.]
MTHPSAAGRVAGRPFTEQVAFFRRKLGNLVPTRAWDDMLGAAHDDGFMVAGAMQADLLADLAAAVDKAIAEGLGIDAFRRDFRAIVARHGWTGWTGQGTTGGEAWRVKTILRANAYTSYSAGRRAQLDQGDFPWWVYRHGGSLEPRPIHLSWDGIALAPDHAFWATHYPPSDWGCSCYVLGARSEAGVRRLGGDPDKQLPPGWDAIDPKTGAPKGVGRGWAYAPGASVSPTVQAMAGKVGSWDHGVARTFMAGLPVQRQDELSSAYRTLPSTADDARRFASAIADGRISAAQPAIVRSLGMVPISQQQQISALLGGREMRRSDFRLTSDFVRHALRQHGDRVTEQSRGQRAIDTTDFARLPILLESPDQIIPGERTGAGEAAVIYRKRIGDEVFNAVVVINRRQHTAALKTFYVGG